MASEEEEKGAKAPQGLERIKLLLAVLGLASPLIAGAAFLGLQPEKRKALEWEYVAKTSLVNAPTNPVNISVLYDGRPVRQLTTISGRLTNTGGSAIQESDVEPTSTSRKFPSIVFDSAKARVPTCNVTALSRPNITAACDKEDETVRIRHGLLNPGDSVSVEIRLDGEPGDIRQLPGVRFRIAGITSETTRYPTRNEVQPRVAWLPMPPVVEWVVLVLTSGGLLALLTLTAVGYGIAFEVAFPSNKNRRAITEALPRATDINSVATATTRELAGPTKELYSSLVDRVAPNWFDDVSVVRTILSRPENQAAVATFGASAEQAAERLQADLRHALPKALGQHLFLYLPIRRDAIARRIVQQLPVLPGESLVSYVRRAEQAVRYVVIATTLKGKLSALATADTALASALIVIGIAATLVVTGAWRHILTAP